MTVYALSCPNCQVSIRSSKPIPEGTKLTCPKCATVFLSGKSKTVSSEVVAARATAPDKTALASTQPPPVGATPDVPNVAKPQGNRGLAALVIGGVVFLALGGALLAYCFRAGATDDQPPATDNPQVAEIAEPEALVKKVQPLIELTPQEEAKVKAATQKGVDHLKKLQSPEGHWDYIKKGTSTVHRPGATALAALTLLESGVAKNDPVIEKAAQVLRDAAPALKETYDLALSILFFDKLNDTRDKQHIQAMGLRLIAGQNAGGGWTYICPVLKAQESDELATIVRRLSEAKRGAGVTAARTSLASNTKRFRSLAVLENMKKGDDAAFRVDGRGDNSNTQFALLALWTARRHDVPVDPSLGLVSRRFRAIQNNDGSYPYQSTGAGKPSMTCAGLLGLSVGFGIKDKGTAPPPLQDPAVKKALVSIGKSIGTTAPAGGKKKGAAGMPALYTMWSIERVAVLYQLKEIEGKRWYHWGMDLLLASQKPDGHWGPGTVDPDGTALANTCFALLFLQRVNLAGDLTDKLKDFEAIVGGPIIFRDDDD